MCSAPLSAALSRSSLCFIFCYCCCICCFVLLSFQKVFNDVHLIRVSNLTALAWEQPAVSSCLIHQLPPMLLISLYIAQRWSHVQRHSPLSPELNSITRLIFAVLTEYLCLVRARAGWWYSTEPTLLPQCVHRRHRQCYPKHCNFWRHGLT